MKKVNKEMQEVLNNLDTFNNKPLESLTPEIARQQSELKDAVLMTIDNSIIKKVFGIIETVSRVEHIVISNQGYKLLVRIYIPRSTSYPQPAVLYFHGGGMVIGNLNSYDASCRAICNAANCIVVSVAYRQAPEHKFPAAADDAFFAYEWVLKNADALQIDKTKIAVMGESAGGNLAAGVCLQAKFKGIRQPIHQVLIYPMMQPKYDTESYIEHEFAKPLNMAMMKWFWNHYLDGKIDNEILASPALTIDLTGLASATIVLAEIDPLRSEGQAYADRLKLFGVAVNCRLFEGVTHEFFGMGAVLFEARHAVNFVSYELNVVFGNTPTMQELYISTLN